jgi:hypothetical protein
MATTKVEPCGAEDNLLLAVPAVLLAEIVSEAVDLGRRYPEILESIRADQDRAGMAKKQLRCEQQAWLARQTPALPRLETTVEGPVVAAPLHGGRPRMAPETVLVFLVVSHYFHSVYSATASERLLDSLSLHAFLQDRGLRLPGLRTIGDNVNLVGAETRGLILRCQLQLAAAEGLDDFSEVCGDSTACAANTKHPTDSGLMLRLLDRVFRNGQALAKFGLPAFRQFSTPRWLAELKRLDFAINMAKTAKDRKKLYRKYLKIAAKLLGRFGDEAQRVCGLPETARLDPIRRGRLDRLWRQLVSDLTDSCHIHVRCEERVLDGKRLKGTHRVLSTVDRAAAWIAKGDRVPTVGYKPQLARSRNGFVSALLVPEGNAADSAMCVPLVEAAAENTGVVPALASFDDGYTSAGNLAKLKRMGVASISFGGSKGRRLLGDEPYRDGSMLEARRNRSAVESLMFCLKHGHEFGQLRRRGIDAVRDELAGKAIVYNLCRTIMLRRKAKKLPEREAEAA